MRLLVCIACSVLSAMISARSAEPPRYTIDAAIRVARAHNPDVAIAQENVQAARGELVEARSGYLPAVVSSGLYRQREQQGNTNLRPEDYNANIRVVQSLYSGGATPSRTAIGRLKLAKAQAQLEAVVDRVTMDVRLAFYQLLLNRERIHVREESVAVLQQQVKTQRERFRSWDGRRVECKSRRGIGGERRTGVVSGPDGFAKFLFASRRIVRRKHCPLG